MEFIRKHTDGPLCFDGNDIRNKNGRLIIDCDNIKPYDMNAMVMAPDMINYMVERAEYLQEITKGPDDSSFNDATKRNKAELKRILEILRAAGVEVVE